MIVQIDPTIVEYSPKTQDWCTLPYKNHPKGCPNYGTSHTDLRGIRIDLRARVIRECPPTKILIDDVFDFEQPLYIIYNKFELGLDAEQRRIDCPHLPQKGQWYNLRYWQGRARKQLYTEIANFLDEHENTIVDLCPETHGARLTSLMKHIGVNLKWNWPPKEHRLDNVVYQIAMGGYKNN